MTDIPIKQRIINNFRNRFLPAIGAMTGDSSFFGLSTNWEFCTDINLSSCSIYSSNPQYQLQMPTFESFDRFSSSINPSTSGIFPQYQLQKPTFECFDRFSSSINPSTSGIFPQYQLQTPTFGPYDFSFASTNLYSPIIGTATPSVSAGTTSTLGTDTGIGEILPDGTMFEVAGIDYSIFGNYANQIKCLRPLMQQKMELLFKYAKNKGWKITFNSMFRSYAKQEHLYNEYLAGRGNLAAKPGTSRHEFGCAVDLQVNGSSRNAETRELGAYAQTIGMRWGGNTISEPWHFDLDPAKTPKARRASASSAVAQSSSGAKTTKLNGIDITKFPRDLVAKADSLYTKLGLQAKGLDYGVFLTAYIGYNQLTNKGSGHLGIFDTTQSSSAKRYYLIDMNNQRLIDQSEIKAGTGNMGNVTTANKNGSHATLSGFEIIAEEYSSSARWQTGRNIDGLEKGINDSARTRRCVAHYTELEYSYGCKAIDAVLNSDGSFNHEKSLEKLRKFFPKGTILFTAPTGTDYWAKSQFFNQYLS